MWKRSTYYTPDLLEPNFKIGIENRNERRWFLSWTLGNSEEIGTILRSKKLAGGIGVLREECINESGGTIQLLETLQDAELRTTIHTREALLDTPQPIAGQVS